MAIEKGWFWHESNVSNKIDLIYLNTSEWKLNQKDHSRPNNFTKTFNFSDDLASKLLSELYHWRPSTSGILGLNLNFNNFW